MQCSKDHSTMFEVTELFRASRVVSQMCAKRDLMALCLIFHTWLKQQTSVINRCSFLTDKCWGEKANDGLKHPLESSSGRSVLSSHCLYPTLLVTQTFLCAFFPCSAGWLFVRMPSYWLFWFQQLLYFVFLWMRSHDAISVGLSNVSEKMSNISRLTETTFVRFKCHMFRDHLT